MTQAGIMRFDITDKTNGRGAWRFVQARAMWQEANRTYRRMFEHMGIVLAADYEEVKCSLADFQAGYDYALGIDVVFTLASGQTITAQEKFLFTKYNTVTVEYMQDWREGIEGDWFSLKCQHYFVGYCYNFKESPVFDKWIMLDWARVLLATEQRRINWWRRQNAHDGARADFKYVEMDDMPADVVICRNEDLQMAQGRLL